MNTFRLLSFSVLLVATFTPTASALNNEDTLIIQTAFDSYLPLLLWGGLWMFCLWLSGERITAWFPASMALLNLANEILPTPVAPRILEIMLFVIAFSVHSILTAISQHRDRLRPEDSK
jgi:hypothetical protein